MFLLHPYLKGITFLLRISSIFPNQLFSFQWIISSYIIHLLVNHLLNHLHIIDYTYNQIIAKNIIASNKNKKYQFVTPEKAVAISSLLDKIRLEGEEEERYADLSQVDDNRYEQLIKDTDSDYVLFLNQHYLKWQEKPLRTLFHITSYSLFDKNQKEVTRGNNYFTSMNLESKDKLSKDSRKSSSKIVSTIVKSLSK